MNLSCYCGKISKLIIQVGKMYCFHSIFKLHHCASFCTNWTHTFHTLDRKNKPIYFYCYEGEVHILPFLEKIIAKCSLKFVLAELFLEDDFTISVSKNKNHFFPE